MCWLGEKTNGKAIIAQPTCWSKSHGGGGHWKNWNYNFMLSNRVDSFFYLIYITAIFLWHQPKEGRYEKTEKRVRRNPPEIETKFKPQNQIVCDCCGGPMRFYFYDGGVGGVLECINSDCEQDHGFNSDGSHYCAKMTLHASSQPGEYRYLEAVKSIKKEREFSIRCRRFLNVTDEERERKEMEDLSESVHLSLIAHKKALPWWRKIRNRKSAQDLI